MAFQVARALVQQLKHVLMTNVLASVLDHTSVTRGPSPANISRSIVRVTSPRWF